MKKMMFGLLAVASLLMCSCTNKRVEALLVEADSLSSEIKIARDSVVLLTKLSAQLAHERADLMRDGASGRALEHNGVVMKAVFKDTDRLRAKIEDLEFQYSMMQLDIKKHSHFWDRHVINDATQEVVDEVKLNYFDDGNTESSK